MKNKIGKKWQRTNEKAWEIENPLLKPWERFLLLIAVILFYLLLLLLYLFFLMSFPSLLPLVAFLCLDVVIYRIACEVTT